MERLEQRRGRERWAYNERILGSSDCIEKIWQEAQRMGGMMRNTGGRLIITAWSCAASVELVQLG